jgi:hypothetical protein
MGIESWLPVVWRVVVLTFYERRDLPKSGHGRRAFVCASDRVGLDRLRK